MQTNKLGHINPSIQTFDVDEIAEKSDNLYASVAIASKRARQIAVQMKEELSHKLADFATTVDNLEEIFENKEQIEISKYYERLPKPTNIGLNQFMNDELEFRYKEIEEGENEK